MKVNFFVNLFLLIFLFSCDRPPQSSLELFNGETKLSGQVKEIDSDEIGNPIGIQVLDSSILILDRGREYCLSVFSKRRGNLIQQFGKKGRGPNELTRAISIDYNAKQSTIDVFTRTPKRINSYNIDSVCGSPVPRLSKDFMPEEGSCYHVKRIERGAISTGRFEKGRYAFFDLENDSVSYYGDYPTFNRSHELNSVQKAGLIQGLMKVHPSQDKFVFASNFAEVIEVNSLKGGIFKPIRRHSFNNSGFKKGNGRVFGKRSNLRAYIGITVSDRYIYALYTNKSLGEYVKNTFAGDYLLVYDWEGNPLKKYKLDKPLSCIAYDKSDNSAYGLALDEGIQLVKYNLDI